MFISVSLVSIGGRVWALNASVVVPSMESEMKGKEKGTVLFNLVFEMAKIKPPH